MNILTGIEGRVATIQLNRPEALNALSSELMRELIRYMQALDCNPDIGCFLITGSEKIFAAGADIKEMAEQSYMDMVREDFFPVGMHLIRFERPRLQQYQDMLLEVAADLQ